MNPSIFSVLMLPIQKGRHLQMKLQSFIKIFDGSKRVISVTAFAFLPQKFRQVTGLTNDIFVSLWEQFE